MPGIARQMTDDPDNIHVITGSGHLRVHRSVGQKGEAAVLDLVDVISHTAKAKALRPVHPVVVDLRLGMLMGRIAAPLTGEGIRLSQHQIGIGRGLIVKDRGDSALTGAAADLRAGGDIADVLCSVKPGGKVPLVFRGP